MKGNDHQEHVSEEMITKSTIIKPDTPPRTPTTAYRTVSTPLFKLRLAKDIIAHGGLHNASLKKICNSNPNLYGHPHTSRRKSTQNQATRWRQLTDERFCDLVEELEKEFGNLSDQNRNNNTTNISNNSPIDINKTMSFSVPSDVSSGTGSASPYGADDFSDCREFNFAFAFCFCVVLYCVLFFAHPHQVCSLSINSSYSCC